MVSLVIVVSCAAPDDEPVGEEIWTIDGGLRDPCIFPTLYRNGMRVEYREYEDCELRKSWKGRLTDRGLEEYVAASAVLSPGTVSSCLAIDRPDAIAVAFDGTDTFEVRYCASSTDHAAGRLEKFLSTLRTGLEECTSHEWFDAC